MTYTINPFQLMKVAKGQRPGVNPKTVYMGRNWPNPMQGMVINFSGQVPVTWPRLLNTPDADSCVVWEDGFVTVLRDDNEPNFGVAPPRLGKAGGGVKAPCNRPDPGGKRRKGKKR